MMRLIGVELRRYASRRAVRASGVLALLAILTAGVIVAVNSDPSEAAMRRGLEERERLIEECRSAETSGFASDQDCEEAFGPEGAFDPRFALTELAEVFDGLSFLLIIIAMGLGATFIGAEWSAGTVTTVLTWEPRRRRVFAAKVVAAMIFIAVAVMAVLAILVLVMAVVAMWRGSTAGADAGWFADLGGTALRSAVVCALAGVIALAIASAARNTAAALIAAFIYFTVVENVIRGFRPNWFRWLPGDNMALFVIGAEGTGIREISETRALITIVSYALVFFVVSLTIFRARDIT